MNITIELLTEVAEYVELQKSLINFTWASCKGYCGQQNAVLAGDLKQKASLAGDLKRKE